MKGAWFMTNKFTLTAVLALASAAAIHADPPVTTCPATVGSVWGHPCGAAAVSTAGPASICSDPIARSVGDLVTIVVDLDNTVTKAQNTTTAKTATVNDSISQLVYPNDGSNHGWNWYTYHGANPGMVWSGAHTFNGGGAVANTEADSTTIQARVISVAANGVLRVEATRMSKAGEEDTSMILTGLVRPEDLSTANTISSSRVADLEILQKGKGTLTENQRKGWLTKIYEFLSPF
jgi:flagellar L-ring protein precursor FlgH